MARGHQAAGPSDIPARGWKDILLRVKNAIGADHVGLVAAGIAFYALLALFPAIGAGMALAAIAVDPATITAQLERVGQMLPQQAAEIVVGQAREVAGAQGAGLGLAAAFGILISLYSATKGVKSLVEGLNVAYGEQEDRGFVRLALVIFALTVFAIIGVLVALVMTAAVPAVLAAMQFGRATEIAATVLRWPVLAAMVVAGLAVLYRFGPSRAAPRWRWITPGAVVACLLWIAGSILFSVYVRNFASYNETFGSLAGVIILLMWLWLSAYVVLIGAELDAEMEAQTAIDTTAGRPLPAGKRGAVKADTLPGDAADERS